MIRGVSRIGRTVGGLEGLVFQREVGERLRIQDLDEGFQYGLREFQDVGEGLIPAGVEIGKDVSLQRSLRRGYTKYVMKRGLYTSVIEASNRCINSEGGIGVGDGLSMVATYTQVENALGLHLRYSHIM